MKKVLFVLMLIAACANAACGRATKNARDIDPRAKCVSRKADLALCEMSDGRLYLCDDDRCIFVGTPAAAAELPLSDGDYHHKTGED